MAADTEKILVINPGSTSTKAALFIGMAKHAEISVEHATADVSAFEHLLDQLFFREGVIRGFMRQNRWRETDLDAVVGRGGLLHPLEGGIYAVGPDMIADLRSGRYGEHASNLGAPLAREIADRADCPAYIVDPVVVDELDEVARLSGHPDLPRRSIFHALNQRSVARLVASRLGKAYEDCRFIVAHMGGGITIGVHVGGRVVDVNNGLDGDGPFTPERSGSLPAGQMVSLCFHSGKTEKEIRRMIKGGGGVVAYCGTNDMKELADRAERGEPGIDGRPAPSVVLDAISRQIAQAVCAHGATLKGRVDAVIFTGGMARGPALMERLRGMCEWMAPVEVVPGEREMEALAEGAVRALRGLEPVKEYVG